MSILLLFLTLLSDNAFLLFQTNRDIIITKLKCLLSVFRVPANDRNANRLFDTLQPSKYQEILPDQLELGVPAEAEAVETATQESQQIKESNSSLQLTIDSIKEENQQIKESNNSLQQTVDSIKEENQQIKDEQKQIKDEQKQIKDEQKQIKDEQKQIKDEQKQIKDEQKQINEKIRELMKDNQDIKDEHQRLALGQVAYRVEAEIWKVVLPNEEVGYTGIFRSMIEWLDENVSSLEGKKAQQRWNDLKRKLNWNEKRHKYSLKVLKQNEPVPQLILNVNLDYKPQTVRCFCIVIGRRLYFANLCTV